jgi:hypothetical protein
MTVVLSLKKAPQDQNMLEKTNEIQTVFPKLTLVRIVVDSCINYTSGNNSAQFKTYLLFIYLQTQEPICQLQRKHKYKNTNQIK